VTGEQLTAVVAWIEERWSEPTPWSDARLADWLRTPAEAVWGHLVAHADNPAPPTPGETREATKATQTPLEQSWESWRQHFGYDQLAVDAAVKKRHLAVYPKWSSECRCFTNAPDVNLLPAAQHIACHVKNCDLHTTSLKGARNG
jgi:hypothetical protein